MPVHDYVHEATGETVSVYVPANAPTEDHQRQERDGKLYKRVYTAPRAATNILPGTASRDDFMRTTDSKNYKVGDLWQISQEMSQHRADKNGGHDPVREKFYKDYERENGEPHTDVARREKLERANKTLSEWGFEVKL